MSIISSVGKFVDHAAYALKQGLKEDYQDWTGSVDNAVSHGSSGAVGAIKGGISAYKSETTGLHFAEKSAGKIAEKVAEKAIVKGVADFVAGPLAWSTDIYHIVHGTIVGWKSYGK
ncbi:hypothetical protein ACWNXI_10210 [Caldibacillus thermoamylovorans]